MTLDLRKPRYAPELEEALDDRRAVRRREAFVPLVVDLALRLDPDRLVAEEVPPMESPTVAFEARLLLMGHQKR